MVAHPWLLLLDACCRAPQWLDSPAGKQITHLMQGEVLPPIATGEVVQQKSEFSIERIGDGDCAGYLLGIKGQGIRAGI